MFSWRIYVVDNYETYLDIRVKGATSSVPRQIFIKAPSFKFQLNPSSGRRADTGGQTYMTKVTGAFRVYPYTLIGQ